MYHHFIFFTVFVTVHIQLFSAGLQDVAWFYDKVTVPTPSSILLPYSQCVDISDGWRYVCMQLYLSYKYLLLKKFITRFALVL